MLRSSGEWFTAYQRVTHYFRALGVRQPPPHLLAMTVLERALGRANEKHDARPIRLAMAEIHGLLAQSAPSDGGDAGEDAFGSVRWRIRAWLADGERDIVRAAGAGAPFTPVPVEAPGSMIVQPLEESPLARTARALTAGFRHLCRRHA